MTARTGYKFPTIKDIEQSSRATVASELADVSRFLRDERTTVTGERRFISNFQEMMGAKGYGDLVESPDDVYNVLQFLDEMREEHKEMTLPSGDLLDALQEAERLKIPKDKLAENIDLFVAHLDELENIPVYHNDPFDRLIICQARTENLVIITRDTIIPKYPVQTVW